MELIGRKDILAEYLRGTRQFSKEDVTNFDASQVGIISDECRFVLAYMEDIEKGVWTHYIGELTNSPTGRNPLIKIFLMRWYEEEWRHGMLVRKILDASGEPIERVTQEYVPNTRIANLMGERLFAGIHMCVGAVNELTARLAYQQLAKMLMNSNPYCANILQRIAAEESLHFRFYYRMAQWYLTQSRTARMITAPAVNFAAKTGVGADLRSQADAYRVIQILFSSIGADQFHKAVTADMKKLPGFGERFTAMHTLMQGAGIQ